MAEAKSEKEKWLNYTIKLLAKNFFGSISSLQLLAAKAWHGFLFKTLQKSDNKPILEVRTLHTVGSKNVPVSGFSSHC